MRPLRRAFFFAQREADLSSQAGLDGVYVGGEFGKIEMIMV